MKGTFLRGDRAPQRTQGWGGPSANERVRVRPPHPGRGGPYSTIPALRKAEFFSLPHSDFCPPSSILAAQVGQEGKLAPGHAQCGQVGAGVCLRLQLGPGTQNTEPPLPPRPSPRLSLKDTSDSCPLWASVSPLHRDDP